MPVDLSEITQLTVARRGLWECRCRWLKFVARGVSRQFDWVSGARARGDERLSEQSGNDNHRPRDHGKKAEPRRRRAAKGGGELGSALRSVYDSTVDEEIPDDFLKLLGKLS